MARPRKPDKRTGNGWTTISVKVPPETYKKLCEWADEKNTTVSAIVRRGIMLALRELEDRSTILVTRRMAVCE